MRKIIVSQFVSVDGVIEDPVGIEGLGRGAWSSQFDSGDEGQAVKFDEMMESDAMLMGRRTYDGYVAAWPSRRGEYADKINSMPKYVVSTTLHDPEWINTTVIDGDIGQAMAKLKQESGRDILVHGSAQLVQTLMKHDLVDEWRLMVFPIVVGAGKRNFGDPGQAVALRLADSRPVGSDGVVLMTYERTAENGDKTATALPATNGIRRSMPASTPEEIPALLAAAMNGGDLDAFIELHEPNATTIVPPEGSLVNGRAEIRAALEPIFATGPKLENEVVGKLEHEGLALTHTRWALRDPDGQTIELAGRGTIVSRRQPDGSWLIVLENTLSPA